MMERNFLLLVFAIILVTGIIPAIKSSYSDFSTVNYGDKSEVVHQELHNIFKEELQELRKELTTSFVEEHSRRKRAIQGYRFEAELVELEGGPQNTTFVVPDDDVAPKTFVFQNDLYILEKEGIYRINGLDVHDTTTNGINRTLVSRWVLSDDHRVVATIEKSNVLFILVENSKEGFSFIYTFTSFSQTLVLRQRIRNPGFVTSAKFFVFYDQLYLIILNDNRVHSLTVCPIFLWAGTYFDEMHTIQTRGANAVEAFVIEGYQYLAICQAIDAAGNTEVGTQVVRMDRRGELEKVQLLYSNNPVALHFTKNFHEHILIIAQKKEPAIVYFFGGYDFVYLQHLPSLKGEQVSMLSILAPDGETFILASNGRVIRIFARATDYSPLTALMFAPYPNNTLEAPKDYTITGLTVRPPSFTSGQPLDHLFIAITYKGETTATIIHLLSLVFVKKPRISNSYKQPEDKLSNCLTKLKSVLDTNEPILKQLQRSNDTILRKSSNMNYEGMLNSQTRLSLTSQFSKVDILRIKPDLNSEDEIKLSPVQFEAKLLKDIEIFNNNLPLKLSNVLIRDETNILNGHLNFVNGVAVKDLVSTYSTMKLTNLNDVPWTRLRHSTLRNDNDEQVVTGNWSIETLSTEGVITVNSISGVILQDILLTQTEPQDVQTVTGHVVFEKDVEFRQPVYIPPNQRINNLEVSDIANKSFSQIEITGVKTATHVNGGTELIVQLVNGINLDDWYNSILKTTGEDQVANGTYFFDGNFTVDNLQTELLNRVNWNEFMDQILVNGKDQIITNEVHFGNLVAEAFQANDINGVVIDDLLTASRHHNVTAKISTDKLVIVRGDVASEQINGIRIPNDVVVKGQDATISSPIEFFDLTVDEIDLADGALISGVDLVEKAKEGKTVIYRLSENDTRPITFADNFYALNIKTPTVNGIDIENFMDTHWKVHGHNIISIPNIDFTKFKVMVENSFTTGLLNDRPITEYVQINGSDTEDQYLNIPVHFLKDVIIYGNVQMADNVTLNDIDLSDFVKKIVKHNSTGFVHGVKNFTQPISSNQGIGVGSINNRRVDNDVVMLRNGKSLYEIPGKTIFSDNIEANTVVVYGNTTVGRTVNAIDIGQITETTVYTTKYGAVYSDVEFMENISVTDFNVGGMLKNFFITHILETLVPLNSVNRPQYLALNLVIEGNVDFQGPTNIGLINGVDPSAYFPSLVNKSSNEFIQNQKTFKGEVVIQGNLNCDDGTINNVNLQKVESQALSKTKNQTVTGHITFKRIQAGVIFTRSLCRIPVDDFVLINDNRTIEIESPVYFTGSGVTIVEGDVVLGKLFNGQNITKVADNLTNVKGNRTFSTVNCHGNLSWTKSRVYGKGLSYVFKNAVVTTGRENQTITGNVTFLEGFKAESIKTLRWLNGVDLAFIVRDGVFDDKRDLNFTGKNNIPDIHITDGGWLDTLPVFSTNFVNGINLTQLNQVVARKNSTRAIKGVKILRNGVFTESLNAGHVNGCSLEDPARVNDSRWIRSLTFENVDGLNEVQFNNLEGMDWTKFVQERVTFDTPQQINGNITFNGNVIVKHCTVHRINDVNLNELVVKNANHVQRIKGQKTIGGLKVVGDVQADSVNNYDMDDIHPKVLYKNQPRTINQTVYFEGPVYLHKDLEVAHHVNERHSLRSISSSFDYELNEIISKANSTQDAQKKSQYLLKLLQGELQDSASWLDYFGLASKLPHIGKKDRVEVAVFGGHGAVATAARIGFSKMIRVTSNENGGGLPNGCLCNSIHFVEISAANYFRQVEHVDCKNIFDVSSSYSDSSFTIYSTYTSYNETCKSTDSGVTDIITNPTTGHFSPVTPTLVSRIPTGFVSDAKMFNDYGVDYIVIAQFYDHTKVGPYKGEISVYAVTNSTTLTLVQTIPTKGTIKLSIEHVNNVWFLGVANSLKDVPITRYEDDNDACETVSEIFVWQQSNNNVFSSNPSASSTGKFVLLREVTTKNVIDVEIIKIPRRKDDFAHAAFIAFAHSGSVVEIFKFDWTAQNFFLQQTFAFDDEFQVTSVTSFSIKDSTYLIISSIPQGLLVYEYRCIEGFKLYLEVPMSQVEDVNSFVLNNKLLFPIASSFETIIAKGKVQGFLSNK